MFIVEKNDVYKKVYIAAENVKTAEHDLFYKVHDVTPADELPELDPSVPDYSVVRKKLMKRADIINAIKDLKFTDIDMDIYEWLAYQKYQSLTRVITSE